MPRFVVVTPVMNGSDFIRESLSSVLAQTDDDWVHYVVDGGSTDGTLEILAEVAAQDSRLRIVTGKDRGIFDAWLKGFEQAYEDGYTDPRTICVWLGSDDLIMPWAFSTLRQHFDETGAEWVTALPSTWDLAGRLEIVQPFNWYPRRLIRAGQFHNRSLGSLQMESIFFTRSLLAKLSPAVLETVRTKKLAGDFLLWREFARHTDLISLTTAVSGFRLHGANRSSVQEEGYFREVRETGVWLPPKWLGTSMRASFRLLALWKTDAKFRNAWGKFAAM